MAQTRPPSPRGRAACKPRVSSSSSNRSSSGSHIESTSTPQRARRHESAAATAAGSRQHGGLRLRAARATLNLRITWRLTATAGCAVSAPTTRSSVSRRTVPATCPGYAVAHGGVPERSNGPVLKTGESFAGLRGFKSHPRRFVSQTRIVAGQSPRMPPVGWRTEMRAVVHLVRRLDGSVLGLLMGGVPQPARPPVRALVRSWDSFERRHGRARVGREPGCVTRGERRGGQAVQEH